MAYQTPYFVIDENQLMKDFQMLKSSLETSWGNYRIGYSFKTNSLPWNSFITIFFHTFVLLKMLILHFE